MCSSDLEGRTSNEVAAAFEGKGGKRKWKAKGKDVAPAKARLDYEGIKNSRSTFTLHLARSTTPWESAASWLTSRRTQMLAGNPRRARSRKKANKDDDEGAISMSEDEDPKPTRKEKKYPKVKQSLVCFLGTPTAKEEKAELRAQRHGPRRTSILGLVRSTNHMGQGRSSRARVASWQVCPCRRSYC